MYRPVLSTSAALLLTGCISITTSSPIDPSPRGARAVDTVASADRSVLPAHQRDSQWFRDAEEAVRRARRDEWAAAKNVIFFLGDGMGISTVTAARILAGQRLGGSGEEHSLAFETLGVTGLAKTYNVNSQTADSAGTMSALMTGVKTDIGVFGVDERVQYNDCASSRGSELLSLLDIAELAGRRTGVVSTARLTHATPGATYARVANRDWEDDSSLPEGAREAGCSDIAAQLVGHRERLNSAFGEGASDGIEVAMGGGRRHFLPPGQGGRRADGRDLIADWQRQYPRGSYAADAAQLSAVQRPPLLGLFDASHMEYAMQRATPESSEPSLTAMTLKALELLEGGDEGYFLMVEAGRIDHAHHAGNAANALNETIELSDTVAAVLERVDLSETLIIVTADHSHVFTMAGYPRRGNPILGKVVEAGSEEPSLDVNGLPYTTLGYMNGRGFRNYGEEFDADRSYGDAPRSGREDLTEIDTTAPGYHQEALIPLGSETHGGEDVPVYAGGPGAIAAMGSYEQNRLFHVMLQATGWDREAARRVRRLDTAR
jgi:alkaline phosphatase